MKIRFLIISSCLTISISGCQFFSQKEPNPLKRIQQGKNIKPADVIEFQNKVNLNLNSISNSIDQKKYDEAELKINEVLKIDSTNKQALFLRRKIQSQLIINELINQAKELVLKQKNLQAKEIINKILVLDPNNIDALNLKSDLYYFDLKNNKINNGTGLDKTISLEFKKAPLIGVLDLVSQYSGLNFVIDKDTDISNMSVTIFAKNTTVSEVLNLIIRTNGLNLKKLNNQTFLIYANNENKNNIYDEFYTQTFYLNSIPVDKAKDMVEKLYNPKSIFSDNKLNFLVVRDKKGVIDGIEKLLSSVDIDTPEVLFNIEILEISKDSLLGLGLEVPDKIDMKLLNSIGGSGIFSINDIKNFSSNSIRLLTNDTIASLNLKQTSTKSNLLANPRIRVKSKELASFLIGDKVPVITTTTGESANFLSESVSYLDVGLKLEILPNINKNNQIDVDIKLEVSNIIKEIKSKNGLLAYQIGTRNTSTKLQLLNGETQMLAGLIRDDSKTSASHIPGIGRFPILGRLFSNTLDNSTKNEIVLLITPYVVKPFNSPESDVLSFYSGTNNDISVTPLRVSEQTSLLNKSILSSDIEKTNSNVYVNEKNKLPFKMFLIGANTNIKKDEAVLSIQHTPLNFKKISLITSLSDNLQISNINELDGLKFIGEEMKDSKKILSFESNNGTGTNLAIVKLKPLVPKPGSKEKFIIEKAIVDEEEINLNLEKDITFE
ncbi:hypothetical protein ACPF64_09785 [Acinetobacter sp. KB005]|uniref:hypothetical protein n=1 Tax=Acinetobacter sp. KB005 TaxID=3416667 RepID=UPI003CF1540E